MWISFVVGLWKYNNRTRWLKRVRANIVSFLIYFLNLVLYVLKHLYVQNKYFECNTFLSRWRKSFIWHVLGTLTSSFYLQTLMYTSKLKQAKVLKYQTIYLRMILTRTRFLSKLSADEFDKWLCLFWMKRFWNVYSTNSSI